MAEEEKKLTGNEEDYIDTIQKLKESTVSRDEYDKLVADNKKLIETLAQGGTINTEKEEEKVDVDALRKELYSDDVNLSACDYWEKTLKLRDAVMKQGAPDPFIPIGKNIAPTVEDVQKAENVVKAVRSCLEYADGDSEAFTNELQRITVDAMPQIASNYRRR